MRVSRQLMDDDTSGNFYTRKLAIEIDEGIIVNEILEREMATHQELNNLMREFISKGLGN